MKNNGFSLIELLVGIAIIITSTTVVLSIIVTSFRISNKTTTSDTIRQNGNYAISQISRIIKFGESFGGVSTDGTTYDTRCYNTSIINRYVRINYQGVTRTISCNNTSVYINGISIIDNSVNSIDVVDNTCKITCRREVESGPVIGISFDLMKGGAGSTAERTSRVNFSTQVKMRNN